MFCKGKAEELAVMPCFKLIVMRESAFPIYHSSVLLPFLLHAPFCVAWGHGNFNPCTDADVFSMNKYIVKEVTIGVKVCLFCRLYKIQPFISKVNYFSVSLYI